MSNTILEHTITSPKLDSVEYATELSEVFDKINDNFITLANRDFIKGDTGESLMIESVPLFDSKTNTFTDYGFKLIQYIETIYKSYNLNDIVIQNSTNSTALGLFDNIKSSDAYIHLIYTYHKDSNGKIIKTTEQPISSLYFVFLDGRFANDKLKDINWENYTDISDLSGVLIVENGAFTMLPNAFPTMYYEAGVGLCWKVNGNKTGLLVQGPKGNDGKNTSLLIVKANLELVDNSDQLKGPVAYYYTHDSGFIDIDSKDYADYDGYTAIILNESEDSRHDFYFGKLIHIDDNNGENKLYAYCNQNAGINIEIENGSFLNLMKSINIYDKNDSVEPIPGLFVPITIKEHNNDTEISAHLISATISDLRATDADYKKPKNDFIVAPVDNLNDIDIFKVERYLYVKVNESNNVIAEVSDNSKYSEDLKNVFTYLKDECNYILKYKLTDICYDIETEFNSYDEDTPEFNRTYSRYFAKYEGKRLTDDTTVCYKYGSKAIDQSDTPYKQQLLNSMPTAFSSRVAIGEESKTKKGIYRWELHRELPIFNHDNIDINEYTKSANQHTVMPFKVIYTTDLTPNADSEIMWFNGISVDTYNNGKYRIYGFGYDIENDPNNNLFKIIKCVSTFNEISIDKDLSSDTALNINYNVNVIGSTNNFKRDLAVSGDITGKNLIVSDDITGANGKFKVGANGNIYLNENGNPSDTNYTIKLGVDGTISAGNKFFSVKSNGDITGANGKFINLTVKEDVTATGGISAAGAKFVVDASGNTDVKNGNITTTNGNINVKNGIFSLYAGQSKCFEVNNKGNITTLGGVSNPKIQYVPIITKITTAYTSMQKTQKKIDTIKIDPGNHKIYGIKIEVTNTSFGGVYYICNFKPLTDDSGSIDAFDTITEIDLSAKNFSLGDVGYINAINLNVDVLYDVFIPHKINTEGNSELDLDLQSWHGVRIYSGKLVDLPSEE